MPKGKIFNFKKDFIKNRNNIPNIVLYYIYIKEINFKLL